MTKVNSQLSFPRNWAVRDWSSYSRMIETQHSAEPTKPISQSSKPSLKSPTSPTKSSLKSSLDEILLSGRRSVSGKTLLANDWFTETIRLRLMHALQKHGQPLVVSPISLLRLSLRRVWLPTSIEGRRAALLRCVNSLPLGPCSVSLSTRDTCCVIPQLRD